MKFRILMIVVLLAILGALALTFDLIGKQLDPQQAAPQSIPADVGDSAAKAFKIQ